MQEAAKKVSEHKLEARLLIVLRDFLPKKHKEENCRLRIANTIGEDFDYDIVFLEHLEYRED
jgi:hypothetical protein